MTDPLQTWEKEARGQIARLDQVDPSWRATLTTAHHLANALDEIDRLRADVAVLRAQVAALADVLETKKP